MSTNIKQLIDELCPNGVEWKTLGEIAISLKKDTLKLTDLIHNGKYPVINSGREWYGRYNSYNNEGNALTIAARGEYAGYINYINEKFWAGGLCYPYRSKDENLILTKYIFYALKANENIIMQTLVSRGSIPALNKTDIDNLPIPLPPLPVQEEIVRILDKFTELIQLLERELELRHKQYEYYRNKLLTPTEENGSWLLNGHPVEWKTLGEIGTLIRGSGLQKKDFTENGVGCIHYGQIYTYYGTFADRTISFVSETMARKLKKAQKGDVLISGVSENIEDICKPIGWLGDEICISGDMFAFRHNQNTKYITYLLQTNDFKNYKRKYAQGTKVIRVKPEKILNYNIPIPPLSEQERIVAILDKFDALVNDISQGLPAEIQARKKQYEYYRNKLLTFKEKDS
jgi:type I restriction enzyme S subunit